MTWKTLIDLLAREFRNLRRVPVVSFGFASAPVTNAEDLRREELEASERIDCIVRDFARTRRWPALDEKEKFFLRERMRFAYEYSCIAEISVKSPFILTKRPVVGTEERRLIEWLLIEVWRNSGVINWLDPLLILTQSMPAPVSEWHLDISE